MLVLGGTAAREARERHAAGKRLRSGAAASAAACCRSAAAGVPDLRHTSLPAPPTAPEQQRAQGERATPAPGGAANVGHRSSARDWTRASRAHRAPDRLVAPACAVRPARLCLARAAHPSCAAESVRETSPQAAHSVRAARGRQPPTACCESRACELEAWCATGGRARSTRASTPIASCGRRRSAAAAAARRASSHARSRRCAARGARRRRRRRERQCCTVAAARVRQPAAERSSMQAGEPLVSQQQDEERTRAASGRTPHLRTASPRRAVAVVLAR